MVKRADEIRPGDMFQGHIVQVVGLGTWAVTLFYRNGSSILQKDALVLVEGSVATPPPPEDASPTA
mgnify:CR=1 FL=1